MTQKNKSPVGNAEKYCAPNGAKLYNNVIIYFAFLVTSQEINILIVQITR